MDILKIHRINNTKFLKGVLILAIMFVIGLCVAIAFVIVPIIVMSNVVDTTMAAEELKEKRELQEKAFNTLHQIKVEL